MSFFLSVLLHTHNTGCCGWVFLIKSKTVEESMFFLQGHNDGCCVYVRKSKQNTVIMSYFPFFTQAMMEVMFLLQSIIVKLHVFFSLLSSQTHKDGRIYTLVLRSKIIN